MVGKLNYLTITRPDISFAVSMVSQFMSAPRLPHWEAVLRIVKYLKAHPGRGLFYQANNHLRVEAFTDSDWAGGASDRRSTTGYCTFLVGTFSLGRVRSKQSLLGLVLKLNIEPWPILIHVRLYGFVLSLRR